MNSNFKIVDLNTNTVWGSPNLPVGWINIGSVPFELKSSKGGIAINRTAPSKKNNLRSRDLYVDVQRVRSVYFLINTSFGLRVNDGHEWEGSQVGSILITAMNGGTVERPLILGENIRDWYRGFQPHAVFKLEDEGVVEAFYNEETGESIDMLEVELPAAVHLARISIEARLESPFPMEPATLRNIKAELVETALPAEGKKKPKTEFSAELVGEPIETSYPRVQVLGITCKTSGY